MRPELELTAALRDAEHSDERVRHVAIRNLAPALLAEAGLGVPSWAARSAHARGDDVVALLRRVAGDERLHARDRGLALIGLGELGEASLTELASAALEVDGDDEDAVFRREAAVIALSFVGACTPDPVLRAELTARMRALLGSARPDVRFQAAAGLAEVGGAEVQDELAAALESEPDPDVRESLVGALSTFDPPGPRACRALAAIVSDDAEGPLGFRAALALAGARDRRAGPRLLAGLRRREERDLALEALAALGSAAPPDTAAQARRLTGWLTAGPTRVRAAYLLARLVPAEGSALLDRLARSLRPAVREAVRDARVALESLAARERAAAVTGPAGPPTPPDPKGPAARGRG